MGRQQAALGVVPAQQCLVTDDAAISELDDRLVERLEFVAAQRMAQVALHVQQRQCLAAQAVVEQRGAMAAAILRVVHRRVGIA